MVRNRVTTEDWSRLCDGQTRTYIPMSVALFPMTLTYDNRKSGIAWYDRVPDGNVVLQVLPYTVDITKQLARFLGSITYIHNKFWQFDYWSGACKVLLNDMVTYKCHRSTTKQKSANRVYLFGVHYVYRLTRSVFINIKYFLLTWIIFHPSTDM